MPQPPYTDKQGQYRSFIHQYAKINDMRPAQADMQRYFKATLPSVHSRVVQLERKGFLSRVGHAASGVYSSPKSCRLCAEPS